MKSLKLLVFLFLGLMSCTEDVEINGGGGFKYKNYIQAYIDADTMHIWQNTQTNGYDKTSVAYAYLEGLVYDCKGNNGLENYRKKVNEGEFVYNNIGGVPSAYIVAKAMQFFLFSHS